MVTLSRFLAARGRRGVPGSPCRTPTRGGLDEHAAGLTPLYVSKHAVVTNSIFAGPVARESGQFPDPVTFAAAASQAAWRRSASIVSAHTADTIISVVTVDAPGRYAAVAVARAIVSDALKQQAPAPSQQTGDDRHRARAQQASAA